MKKFKKQIRLIVTIIAFIIVLFELNSTNTTNTQNTTNTINNLANVQTNSDEETSIDEEAFNIDNIPEYSNKPSVLINNNIPFFTNEEMSIKDGTENYSKLDNLGRCGIAICNVSKTTMPTEKRGDISSIKPTGWKNNKYDFIDSKWVYNRCHLIGYQLTAENDNERNLITGTRYLNTEGMLPYENMIAKYVKDTGNHVIYRVTPIFEDNNLLASGVLMEAKSVEDNGKGVMFNVYCYNIQPNVEINYKTGENKKS